MHIARGYARAGRFLAMLMLVASLLEAYDLPALRNANSITVMFKPQRLGEKVEFSFEKQDMNGYTGADSCVFSILAPSGKLVWEETCPDDGDVGTEWKEGPRQLLSASFIAEEEGVYLMKSNTASSDFHLWFDRTKVTNAAWGFAGSSFRFSTGDKLSCYLLLPPKELGEAQTLKMELCIYKNSINQSIGVDAGDAKVLEDVTLPHKDAVTYHQLMLNRLPREDVYHLHADKFVDIVSLKFPGYGSYMFFLEESFARAFAEEKQLEGSLLTLDSQISHAPMAFGRQSSFMVTFLPANADAPFDFATRVFGKDVRFTNGNASAFLDVPVDSVYHGVDLSMAPAGRLEFNLASRGFAHPLSPEKGTSVDLNTMLVWSAVKDAVGYKVELANYNSGKTLSVNAKQNRLMLQKLGDKLTPGVWRWTVVTSDGTRGEESFMLVPQQKFTRLAYCHGFSPAMDSIQEKAPAMLQCGIGLLSTDDIDFARSYAMVNGTRLPLRAVSPSAIGCEGEAANQPGRNQVKFIVYDHSGTRTEASWGFFVGTAPEAPLYTTDKQGNVFCNGTPFFPMIYYGYHFPKLEIEKFGFNVSLGNAFTSGNALEKAIERNLKFLDCGSVFKGYYSKDKTTAGIEADVAEHAASGVLRSHARLGAWMDEMDVHCSADYIKKFLSIYGDRSNGWRGICSCDRSKYKAMADLGDFLVIDHYAEGKMIFSINAAVQAGREAAGAKPLFALLKGFSTGDPELTGFVPTQQDIEYMVWATFRRKANGIGLYQCGDYRMERYPETWKHASELFMKAAALSFAAYGDDAADKFAVQGQKGTVEYRAMTVGGTLYVIAQNTSFDPVIAEMRINGTREQEVKVVFEDRVIPLKDGKFTDAFMAAGTHMYCVDLTDD